MRVPLFSLRDMADKWGTWTGEKREISLSWDLVLHHPWDAVREVLLHEMAHQLAEEILGENDEPSHGPQFHKACRILRADPKGSGNGRLLDQRIGREPAENGDKIILRVKKLMALAGSQNQHEAEAAMGAAHRLMAKYNLDLLSQNGNRNFISIFLGRPALRHRREEYSLMSLLHDFYFVQGIWITAYVLAKGKMGRVLEISGTIQNVQLASYLYDFINRFIDTQWSGYNRDRGLSRYRRTDFAMGVIEGFRSKLEFQGTGRNRNGTPGALMRIEDPLLSEYFRDRYPRTARITAKGSRRDRRVWKDGVSFGKAMVVFRAVTEKGRNRGLLEGIPGWGERGRRGLLKRLRRKRPCQMKEWPG